MNLIKIKSQSGWRMVNLDNVVFVEGFDTRDFVTLHFSNGSRLNVDASGFSAAMEESSSDKSGWSAMARRLAESIDRLSSNMPHSIRMHY